MSQILTWHALLLSRQIIEVNIYEQAKRIQCVEQHVIDDNAAWPFNTA